MKGVNRAWWALSGSKKSTSKRQPMEIDSVASKQPVRFVAASRNSQEVA